MAEDIDKVERARLARKEIIDHMDCRHPAFDRIQ